MNNQKIEKQEVNLIKAWSRQLRLITQRDLVDTIEPSYHILSFGAGRQTWYLLLRMTKLFSNNPKAFVVFSDTGGEHQETYDYLNEYIIPYCELHKINFVTVKRKGKNLYEYCFDKKIVPSMKFRDCTTKFKIAEFRRFLRDFLKIKRNNPCNVYLGISYDEADRMNVSNVQYARTVFPLIDGYREYCDPETTIEDCKTYVEAQGFPPIPKSGCFFCPYAQTEDLLNPKYKELTIALEENNSRFPEILLRGISKNKVKPVRELTEKDITIGSCKSGMCFV